MDQFGCTRILYVPLQFGLQGAQTGTGSESVVGRHIQRMRRKKDSGAHQEVEGQLEFLQTVNELGLSWRLGSQGQDTLCGRIRQWSNT